MDDQTTRLIDFIKVDIHKLVNSIPEKEPSVNFKLSELKEGFNSLTISFSYFVELLNKYCFNIEQSPFKTRNFKFLGVRLDLFIEIFILRNKINLDSQFIFYYFRRPYSFNKPIIIFYLLYYAIFIKSLLSTMEISDIFSELLNQWKDSFISKKIPVNFITPISAFSLKSDFIINEEITIRDISGHIRIEKIKDEDLESSYHFWEYIDDDFDQDLDDYFDLVGTCLYYNTDLSFIYYEDKNNDEIVKLRDEFNEKVLNLIQVVKILYLFGFNFKYKDYIIELPWWFIPYINKFRNINGPFFTRVISKNEQDEFLELYRNVIKCKIFVSDEYKMIIDRYHQIFNRDSYSDIIIDAFIVFEWLFTRGMYAELYYRLCLNVTLFISTNWTEFKHINDLMRDLYDLRSSIVHGGKWKKKGNKIIKKHKFTNPKDVINELKSILNKCIRRLVELVIIDPNVLKKFEKNHYFFETSRVFKNVV